MRSTRLVAIVGAIILVIAGILLWANYGAGIFIAGLGGLICA